MKKLIVIIGICLVLVAMPMTTASPLGKHISLQQHARPMLTNGTFTGVFALKNETGYVPIGTFNGFYGGDTWGNFTGVWSLDNASASGTMDGWYWGHIFWGQLHTDGVNESQWFGGLYRVNTTDSSFKAIAVILGNNDYSIRYAMGTI